MNYLAHALLSPDDPQILLGNLWGDLIRPKDYTELDKGILQGIRSHRTIDAFTDTHPAVDQMAALYRPYQGKYTPVVVDVLMDYMLSLHWREYHDLPLEAFCHDIYGQVRQRMHLIPDRLHPRISRMLEHQWLESCKNRERMEQTLLMLSRRVSFQNKIPDALIPYDLHQETLHGLFRQFFHELREHVNLQSEG